VVVLPEVVFQGRPADQLTAVARELGVTIVVGVAAGSANMALAFGPDGLAGEYLKAHLVPGLEAAYEPGRELLVLAGDQGVLICKDLDFPGLVRSYRRGGARLLLAPAWDFRSDGWLHTRMAVMRGVESGVAVARVARDGRATISDARGVLAVVDQPTSVSATVRLATGPNVYRRFGDWFAQCCVAVCALLVLSRLV
jgi:apolipoprotein N-acyltransferase